MALRHRIRDLIADHRFDDAGKPDFKSPSPTIADLTGVNLLFVRNLATSFIDYIDHRAKKKGISRFNEQDLTNTMTNDN